MTLRMNGSTSGYVELDCQATGGNNNIKLPTSNGSANQFLKNGSTAGTLGWSSLIEDSSGRVGIGTGAPGSLLDIRSASTPSLHISGTGYTPDYRGYLIDFSTNQQTAGITVAASSPTIFLDLYAGGSAANLGGWNGSIRFFTGGNDSYGTERMRIQSDGITLVNRTSARNYITSGTAVLQTSIGGLLVTNGSTDGQYAMDRISFNGGQFYVLNASSTGVILSSGGTSWGAQSDERTKTDLQPIINGLEKVNSLRAVTGRYKTDEEGVSRSFLIAQDVQAVLPEAVSATDDEDSTLSLRYTEVIPLLVAALKESKERIETLESTNASFEARLTTLEAAQ